MKEMDYVVWKEGEYYVSQCFNVNVSSFGDTIDYNGLAFSDQ